MSQGWPIGDTSARTNGRQRGCHGTSGIPPPLTEPAGREGFLSERMSKGRGASAEALKTLGAQRTRGGVS